MSKKLHVVDETAISPSSKTTTTTVLRDSVITRDFDSLNASTQTIMVYTNIRFDLPKLFDKFKVHDIGDVPTTKKRGHIDKKRIDAPVGAIVSIQYNGKVKGPDMRKDRPRCTTSTINHFLNQVTIEISIRPKTDGRSSILNVMIFRDNFKIAGCRTSDDVASVIKYLWGHLRENPETWSLKSEDSKQVHFLTDVVMRNVGFNLGFFIDREKLNILMNDPAYAKVVAKSQYEPTGQTNVKITLYSTTPGSKYIVYVYPAKGDGEVKEEKWDENPYRSTTKKRKNQFVSLIVFSSSETILSGSSITAMKSAYDFFVKVVMEKRKTIEELLE